MDNYILTYFHHGGNVVASPKLSSKGVVDVFVVGIDKDHYSLFEFLSYAKDLGHSNIEGFCCQHTYGEELVPINSDWELLDFVKDLKDGDELDVFHLMALMKILRKKKDRYVGRLGGDEEFIDSSDCDSIDSTDLVDEDIGVGTDLPRRRRISKIRFDDDCGVVVFELGMIFNGPKEFRKTLGRYAVQNRVQIVLRPNETHRVRAKCKFKPKCSWLCYGAIDRDSEDLELGIGAGLTMMADMQKGFLAVVFDLLPNAEIPDPNEQVPSQGFQPSGHSSQESCHPKSSSQPAPSTSKKSAKCSSSKSAPTSSSEAATSTTVCVDTSRVRRFKAAATSTSCGDTRIPITEGIKIQLPPRNRKIVRHKRGRVETTIDADCGGSKRSKNAGFGIYTSPRGTQILNPGTSSQRILQSGTTYKDASSKGVDLGYNPKGLK
ncbi:hypothetical protein FXO38_22691 [Capsicum annuum]|nr:hypothetical protein FXO38_22691 [Capsicum annuum]